MSLITRCPVCTTAFRVQGAHLAARNGRVRCGKCGTVFDGVAGLTDPSRRPTGTRAPGPGKEEPLPPFLVERRPSLRTSILWAALAVLAASVLAGQVAHRYRTEIAVLVPAARPLLQAACEPLGCDVALPRRPDLIGIESSELQADPLRDNIIVLNALLRNRAPFPQQYPDLELTLTDEADRAVLRRVLTALDYLDAPRAATLAASGVAPGAEVPVHVYLDPGSARAAGYRLYLFYP
jgi:predicted Zn finger-like uncharacterized protein